MTNLTKTQREVLREMNKPGVVAYYVETYPAYYRVPRWVIAPEKYPHCMNGGLDVRRDTMLSLITKGLVEKIGRTCTAITDLGRQVVKELEERG